MFDNLGPWVLEVLQILFFIAISGVLGYLFLSIIMLIVKIFKVPGLIAGSVKAARFQKKFNTGSLFIPKKPVAFDRSFAYKCQYCGNVISAQNGVCPFCTGTNGTNPEFIARRRQIGEKYISILKKQEQVVEKAEQAIIKSKKLSGKSYNFPGMNQAFDVHLANMPDYVKPEGFTFTCVYCGRSLFGKSTDNAVCPSCSGSYSDNIELLEKEQEDLLDRRYHSEYVALRGLANRINYENSRKDAEADRKVTKENNVFATIAKVFLKVGYISGLVAVAFFIVMAIIGFIVAFT